MVRTVCEWGCGKLVTSFNELFVLKEKLPALMNSSVRISMKKEWNKEFHWNSNRSSLNKLSLFKVVNLFPSQTAVNHYFTRTSDGKRSTESTYSWKDPGGPCESNQGQFGLVVMIIKNLVLEKGEKSANFLNKITRLFLKWGGKALSLYRVVFTTKPCKCGRKADPELSKRAKPMYSSSASNNDIQTV